MTTDFEKVDAKTIRIKKPVTVAQEVQTYQLQDLVKMRDDMATQKAEVEVIK